MISIELRLRGGPTAEFITFPPCERHRNNETRIPLDREQIGSGQTGAGATGMTGMAYFICVCFGVGEGVGQGSCSACVGVMVASRRQLYLLDLGLVRLCA